jgi:hypothetical protein
VQDEEAVRPIEQRSIVPGLAPVTDLSWKNRGGEPIPPADGAISHTRNVFSGEKPFCTHFSWTDIVFHDTLVSELYFADEKSFSWREPARLDFQDQ